MSTHTIVIINVTVAVTLKIDMTYLGGTLRKENQLAKKMSEKDLKEASLAAKKLRSYQKNRYKKVNKIDYGWVSEGVSQEWLRRFHETAFKSSGRIPKKEH